jgi:hypothetical protein
VDVIDRVKKRLVDLLDAVNRMTFLHIFCHLKDSFYVYTKTKQPWNLLNACCKSGLPQGWRLPFKRHPDAGRVEKLRQDERSFTPDRFSAWE